MSLILFTQFSIKFIISKYNIFNTIFLNIYYSHYIIRPKIFTRKFYSFIDTGSYALSPKTKIFLRRE